MAPESSVIRWLTKDMPRAEQRDTVTMANKRFIRSVVDAAAKEQTQMPWARGARRAAFIAKRAAAAEPQRKTA